MKTNIRRAVACAAFALVLGGTAAPAFATDEPPANMKCNSGRGNNSESTPATDCDPGNSGGHNNGGD